jgi:hypothetical protein
MPSSKRYFSDEGMREKTFSQKLVSSFLALFYNILFLFRLLGIFAFVITFLAVVLFGLLELNFNMNKNFYDKLLDDEKKWFSSVESTNILIDNKMCQTLPLTIDILDNQQKPATYNNFSSNLYWVPEKQLQRELGELGEFGKTLDTILERNNIERLWVFTRGYADKSNAEALTYALNKNYFYNEINYYPIQNEVFDITGMMKTTKVKNAKYYNRDLIYLRANFVKEVYFKTLLEDLKFQNYDLAVLEGQLLNRRDTSFRKVNVYLSFCKKSEDLTLLDKLHYWKMKFLLGFKF